MYLLVIRLYMMNYTFVKENCKINYIFVLYMPECIADIDTHIKLWYSRIASSLSKNKESPCRKAGALSIGGMA